MDAKTAVMLGFLGLATASAQAPQRLPFEPPHNSGQSVTGAFEGWFRNTDGTFSILLGYFNRNLKEEVDVPVGPDNRIEPGGPDRGQPAHFLPRRQWGVFTIQVPGDFGTRKLTWTITANGQTTAVPMSLDPLWEVSPFSEVGIGNTPPVLRFDPNGSKSVQGPVAWRTSMSATAMSPLPLTVWATDDAKTLPGAKIPRTPAVTVTWSKYRGPGKVTFSNAKPRVDPATSQATTEAIFTEPGEYVLLVVANDWSGEGGRGFLCCWTTAHVAVSVQSISVQSKDAK